LTLACPKGYEPDMEILKEVQAQAVQPITLLHDPKEAVADADVINVDVWASMGMEKETDIRLKVFQDYQINNELLAKAPAQTIILHCLPAHRNEEITDEVLESEKCVAFDQAENKMHMHKAILEKLIGGE
jgi:ornithine carbamoyltransferase